MAKPSERRTRALMLSGVAAIGLLLAVLAVFVYLEGRTARHVLDQLQKNATSVRLVGRIVADVDRERILIGRHIFERTTVDMEKIERQIAAERADYEDAAREYAPLVAFPGEPIAWHQLAVDVTAAQHDLEPALALSRKNDDADATRAMAALDPLYEKIGNDAMTLLDVNQQGARRTVARLTRLQRTNLVVRLALTCAIFGFVMLGGLWLTRTIVFGQRELLRVNGELENRNRELDAFSGRVAHDLRGPLGAINLSAEVIAMQAPDAKHATAAIERGVRQISNLIDDLLLLSRVGSMPHQTASAESVADALREDLARLVEQSQGTLRLALEPAQIACNPGLLRQVLWNLGENAVKYRRPDAAPDVEIEGHVDDARYVVRVADNGRGMSGDDARHVFEPFFRSRQTSSIPGTGLGLAIVRRIVDASGGEIKLESTPGRGTTFVLALPLAA